MKIKVVPKVTDISNVDNTVKVEINSRGKLSPKLAPAKFADEKITYRIKNGEIAKIYSNGKIKPKKEGKTKIIISAGGCTKTIILKVYRYVEPQISEQTDANDYNNGSNSSSGADGSSGGTGGNDSSNGSNNDSKSDSGNDDGYFKDSDDGYF